MSEIIVSAAQQTYLQKILAACPELAEINQDALSGAGIAMPPTIVADKGKFITKVDKVETTITFPDNEVNRSAGIVGAPMSILKAIVLKAKPGKEKAWYKEKYTPGQETQSPDCFSDDGIMPDPSSRMLQCAAGCATCPQNVFGSGTDAQGNPGKGKACADRKVIALYAAGSAYRFAVPPASLKSWDAYCNQLSTKGLPLPAVVTAIGFETGDTDYKLTFTFDGMLAEKQLDAVVKMLETPEVKTIVTPRGTAPLAIVHTTETKENVVDLAAEKEKKAEEDKKAKAAKAKAEKEAKVKADAAAAAANASVDLGLGGEEGGASEVSDEDLIAALNL